MAVEKLDPMPVWMADGIRAVDKGKKFGFEPAEVAEQTEETKSETEPKSGEGSDLDLFKK